MSVLIDYAAVDYFRSREQAERTAAKHAQSEAARRIHQQLAQEYARLIQGAGVSARPEIRR